MPNSFSRTTRAVELHRGHRSVWASSVALVVLAGWLAWSVLGRVPLYETADEARLEVFGSLVPIASPVGGRVQRADLRLGREVRAGEVLIELEAGVQEASVREGAARLHGLIRRLTALREQIRHEVAAALQQRRADDAALAQAREEIRAVEDRAHVAEQHAVRTARLQAVGAATEAERERAEAEARAVQAEARAQRLAGEQLAREGEAEMADRTAVLARRRREEVELEAEIAAQENDLERLQALREQHLIRAPATGQVGEAIDLPPGSVIDVGARLGSVIAHGDLRVVASASVEAFGRIHPGDSARVRLVGFPWTEFGRLSAVVTDVAQESRDGRFRVLLELDQIPEGLPLLHGLPAEVEVEAERVSPLSLILRAAGSRRRTPKSVAGGEG